MAAPRFSRFGVSVALAALALAGCNRTPGDNQALLNNQSAAAPLPDLPATLPMTDAPATPVTTAPRVAALPEARPIRTVRVRDAGGGAEYAYADAAYRFSDALGEAPPDYGFDYEGVEPWAWQGYDNSIVFAEPVSGGYRTYYYRPGDEQPYFVRDPYYSYGYDDGQLAVVYAADGAIVPWADYGPQIVYASRYLVRGRDLWRASREERIPIGAESWMSQRAAWFQTQQQWGAARTRQPMWASYAQQDAAVQSHWQAEQMRRAADARRFANWQAQSFHDAPPPRAIPVQWQQASWARDPQRFAPAAAALAGGGVVAVGAVMAHNAAVAAQRQQAATARAQQERQAQLANDARVAQEQARMQASRQHQQMFAQQAQEQARASNLAQRNAQQMEQAQQRANAMNQQREQQMARAQQQQQARNAEVAQRRQQQSMQIERQQARAAEASQRRQQQTARFEQQQQARAQEMQARMQRQQARATESAQHAEMQVARAQEQHEQHMAAPRPPAAPQHAPERGPDRGHDRR